MTLAAVAIQVDGQSLRGSSAKVDRMHRHAKTHGLTFYRTSAGVRNAAAGGKLVRLTGSADYSVHSVRYPYVRPETRTFVERLAGQYRTACGQRLVVTGATRPLSVRLSNASVRSVHPTGMALDLRKPSGACLRWLRRTLASLDGAGVIEAIEEFRPPHFHVAVYPAPYARHVARLTGGRVDASRPTTYAVRPGDSLWLIARRHDTTVQRLKEANALQSTRIVPGQRLKIPPTG